MTALNRKEVPSVKNRYALINITALFAIAAIVVVLFSAFAAPSQEATTWKHKAVSSQMRTQLLTSDSLKPLAIYAALVAQAQQRAAAQAAAIAQEQSQAAAMTASASSPASSSSTASSGATLPTSTTTSSPVVSSGNDGGWQQVAICEEGGSNSPTFGYFGIMPSTWAAYGGTAYSALAGGSSWATQVMIGDKINGGGPPWAPAGCAGAGYSGW